MPAKPEVQTTDYMLGRIEAKVDQLLASQAKTDSAIADLDQRTSNLERGRSWLLGAGAVISAGITGFGALLLR